MMFLENKYLVVFVFLFVEMFHQTKQKETFQMINDNV